MKTRNYKALYAIVSNLDTGGLTTEEFIKDLVFQFTGGRTTHKSEMKPLEYQTLVASLSGFKAAAAVNDDCDVWRKRVMGAIGGWLRLMNLEQNGAMIKKIACKAAKCENFNKIAKSKLQGIYYEFLKKQEAARNSRNINSTNI